MHACPRLCGDWPWAQPVIRMCAVFHTTYKQGRGRWKPCQRKREEYFHCRQSKNKRNYDKNVLIIALEAEWTDSITVFCSQAVSTRPRWTSRRRAAWTDTPRQAGWAWVARLFFLCAWSFLYKQKNVIDCCLSISLSVIIFHCGCLGY